MPRTFCIIGSGAAGSTLAADLLNRGAERVIMLEAGPHVRFQAKEEWIDYTTRRSDPFEPYYDSLEDYINTGSVPYELRGGRLWVRGGTFQRWTGHAFRLQPEDFHLASNTGLGCDWPWGYNTLESFYDQAEYTLGVAGDANDLGHPPRQRHFPHACYGYAGRDQLCLQALERLNITFQHNCVSRLHTAGPEGTSAERVTAEPILRRLEADPRFKLHTGTTARRIICDSNGRFQALEAYVRQEDMTIRIEADVCVVSAGSIESAKILLQSRSDRYPRGLGNVGGQLGKYFTDHPYITCIGVPREPWPADAQPFNTACSRFFDSPAYQATGKFLIEVVDVRDAEIVGWIAQNNDTSDAPFALVALLEAVPTAEDQIDALPQPSRFSAPTTRINFDVSSFVTRSAHHARQVLLAILSEMGCRQINARQRIQWGRHHLGTCRMSADPAYGVVDPQLLVHGTENVYVCGASVFPSAGAANPTLTIVALAHRLASTLLPPP